jgi:hypothetical protein
VLRVLAVPVELEVMVAQLVVVQLVQMVTAVLVVPVVPVGAPMLEDYWVPITLRW